MTQVSPDQQLAAIWIQATVRAFEQALPGLTRPGEKHLRRCFTARTDGAAACSRTARVRTSPVLVGASDAHRGRLEQAQVQVELVLVGIDGTCFEPGERTGSAGFDWTSRKGSPTTCKPASISARC